MYTNINSDYYNTKELYSKHKREPYIFTITAENSVGSTSSDPTTDILPLTIPSPPTNVIATSTSIPGKTTGHAISVSFTPPLDNGGSPIVDYTVNVSPVYPGTIVPNPQTTGTNSPINVLYLANGITYNVTVTARNTFGSSNPSTSVSVTPYGLPDPPTIISAIQQNDGSVNVSFTPPLDKGGYPITKYTVTSNPENITKDGTSSPINLSGFTPGTSYTFTVTCTTQAGTSVSSNVSSPLVYALSPSKPTEFSGTPQNNKILFSFKAPNSNGNPITSYKLRGYYNDSSGNLVYEEDILNSTNLINLTPGTTGTFTMTTTDRTKNYTGTGTIILNNATKTTDNTLSIVQPYDRVKLNNYPIGNERNNKNCINNCINNCIIVMIFILLIFFMFMCMSKRR